MPKIRLIRRHGTNATRNFFEPLRCAAVPRTSPYEANFLKHFFLRPALFENGCLLLRADAGGEFILQRWLLSHRSELFFLKAGIVLERLRVGGDGFQTIV